MDIRCLYYQKLNYFEAIDLQPFSFIKILVTFENFLQPEDVVTICERFFVLTKTWGFLFKASIFRENQFKQVDVFKIVSVSCLVTAAGKF